jgi:hypothetical protein
MSQDLDRLARQIEEEARKLSGGGLDQEATSAVATELARLAGEAASIVDGFARSSKQIPAAPGQGRLEVDPGASTLG